MGDPDSWLGDRGTLLPAVPLFFSRTGLGRPPEMARGGVGLCLQGREVSVPGAGAGGCGQVHWEPTAPRGSAATWQGCPQGPLSTPPWSTQQQHLGCPWWPSG